MDKRLNDPMWSEGWYYGHAAAIRDVEAAVREATFEVPRECSCHEGEMRRAYEPDEYRSAVLAAIASLSPNEAKTP